MSTKRIEIISRTSSVETVEKTRWEKGWDTRRKNEIADLKQQLAKQKSKKKQSRK